MLAYVDPWVSHLGTTDEDSCFGHPPRVSDSLGLVVHGLVPSDDGLVQFPREGMPENVDPQGDVGFFHAFSSFILVDFLRLGEKSPSDPSEEMSDFFHDLVVLLNVSFSWWI